MERRQFLRLGAVASGVFALGGISRIVRGTGAAQTLGVPTVERLVMTNVVDNVYDAFARGGKLDTITVQRAALDPKGLLLFEHGLAYHLESVRGGERREMEASDDGVHLLDPGGLLRLADRVDHTRMTT